MAIYVNFSRPCPKPETGLIFPGNFMILITGTDSEHYGISFVSKYNGDNAFRDLFPV